MKALIALLAVLVCSGGAFAQQQQQDAEIKALKEKVMQGAIAAYPQLTDKRSALFRLARQLFREAAGNPNHPDYARACAVDALRFFTDEAAAELGISPVGQETLPAVTNGDFMVAVKAEPNVATGGEVDK